MIVSAPSTYSPTLCHLVEVLQVGSDDVRLATECLDLGGDLLELVGRTSGKDNIGAGFSKGQRTGGPNPSAGSGDDGYAVVETESFKHHGRDISSKLEHVLVLTRRPKVSTPRNMLHGCRTSRGTSSATERTCESPRPTSPTTARAVRRWR